jgi:SAM-dependent methyltransferase
VIPKKGPTQATASPWQFKEAYSQFSSIYLETAAQRRHFEDQLQAIGELFAALGISRATRILDASCGTGDVLAGLRAQGYESLAGTDGSPEMLAIAQSNEALTEVPLTEVSWADLGQYLGSQNPFGVIYMLGHSLPHAPREDIPRILADLSRNVPQGARFIFDMRKWDEIDGELRQHRDEVRDLGSITFQGDTCQLMDRCHYGSGWQYVTYSVLNDGQIHFEFTVAYSLFTIQEALAWMIEAGFDAREFKLSNWPYHILAGQRR